jgi:hypothetical protein
VVGADAHYPCLLKQGPCHVGVELPLHGAGPTSDFAGVPARPQPVLARSKHYSVKQEITVPVRLADGKTGNTLADLRLSLPTAARLRPDGRGRILCSIFRMPCPRT